MPRGEEPTASQPVQITVTGYPRPSGAGEPDAHDQRGNSCASVNSAHRHRVLSPRSGPTLETPDADTGKVPAKAPPPSPDTPHTVY